MNKEDRKYQLSRRRFLEKTAVASTGISILPVNSMGNFSGSSLLDIDRNESGQNDRHQFLSEDWLLNSSVLVSEEGEEVSSKDYKPHKWYKTDLPSTVLSTLVKNGVYPDPRFGLNWLEVPDSSDEFNLKNDIAKYSHLPDKRNPWHDPYWYRKEFNLKKVSRKQHMWLNFNCINYRADVWINGVQIADKNTMEGMFQRFRYDITAHILSGENVLAVLIHPEDNPVEPDTQLEA